MRDVLLGDIGGTHSRFALLGEGGRPARVHAFANDDAGSLEQGIARYLGATGAGPHTAVLAVAAVLTGPEIIMTNRTWRFHLDDLKARFGFTQVRAVNDFEAQAWALPWLAAEDLRRIGGPADAPAGPKIVLGPGTGLGVAALVPSDGGWLAVASEGGHISFGPATDDEQPVFERLRAGRPVSAEWILSGPGLARLHSALHPGAGSLVPEAIVRAAQAGGSTAAATVRLFVRLLGRFAGDLALAFKATGGVFVSGGVGQGLGAALDETIFRDAFEAHPPYQALLSGIPTSLIVHPQPSLLGCAVLAQHG
jgi:glucokinase